MIEPIRINQYESQEFFGVVSLFTSVPLEAARAIVLNPICTGLFLHPICSEGGQICLPI